MNIIQHKVQNKNSNQSRNSWSRTIVVFPLDSLKGKRASFYGNVCYLTIANREEEEAHTATRQRVHRVLRTNSIIIDYPKDNLYIHICRRSEVRRNPFYIHFIYNLYRKVHHFNVELAEIVVLLTKYILYISQFYLRFYSINKIENIDKLKYI